MNTTNRFVNRMLLFAVGVVLLVLGVGALAAGILATGDAPAWIKQPASAVSDALATAFEWTWQVPGVGSVSVPLVLAAGTLLVLIVILVAFLSTRRQGHSKTVLELGGAGGRTVVDRNVAEAVLTDSLLRRPDVLSARTGAYRIGRKRAVELAVIVRPGAPLGAVVAAAEHAVREWDELLGKRIPILLHLSDRRWRDGFRSPTRVQ